MKVKKCAFTGHRPQSLPFGFNESDERCIALKQTLRAEIIRLIEQKGVTHFISGMALGVDMYAAEIVLGLKSSYEGITLESAIPCESQAEKWTEKQRDRYFEIASKCDKETLIQHHYTSDCMHKRNRYMVDQADFIIAVWDGRPSVRTPLKKCSLTADDGASPPLEWCTASAEMVHGGRGRGAPGRHAGDYSGMPLRLRMDSPSIWMV